MSPVVSGNKIVKTKYLLRIKILLVNKKVTKINNIKISPEKVRGGWIRPGPAKIMRVEIKLVIPMHRP